MKMKLNLTCMILALLSLFQVSLYAQEVGIKGKVVNREGRVPVKGAKVVLGMDTEKFVQTSSTGEFILSGLSPGTYTLTVFALDFQTLQMSVKVENFLKDLNFITLVSDVAPDKVDDMLLTEFDTESSSDAQAMPVLLTSSKDVYENITGYKFGDIRFKNRGYDPASAAVYLNGVYFNDALSGYSPWSLWTGLNEATRNQESTTGVAISDFGVGGLNGTTNINARASQLRKGYRFSIVNSSGQYRTRLMGTYASGEQDNGWSYAISASARLGGNDWVNGVSYNNFAYFASVEKKINDKQRLAFTFLGSPGERGVQGSSTQEVYDMVGSNYYNPNWGFQNGEKRNARVRKSHEPVAMLNYFYNPSEKLSLTATLSYRFGGNGYSALDWYDAPDPRPDYYRNLPSYFANDPYKASYVKEGWLSDWNIRQINWDRMYNINYANIPVSAQSNSLLAGQSKSQYVIEERHIDQNDINAKIQGSLNLSNFSKLNLGIEYRWNMTNHYKKMKDLLGGDYWIDIDKFAERDFESGDVIQNDLNNPNRVIKEGDTYGYNYKGNLRNYKLWFTYKYSKNNIEAYLAAEGGHTSFWREGLYKKGLFPNNSLGNSEKQNFWTYTAKTGFTYKLSGNQMVYANVAFMQTAPLFQEAFVSPRTRNSVVPDLTTEKTFGADINYSVRFPFLKLRFTGFYTTIKDQTKLISFYDDINSSFTNLSMRGIDQVNTGMELGFSVPLFSGISADGAVSYGNYVYSSNPYVTQTIDNSDAIILENERVYWKDYKIPGTPQTAINFGFNYRSASYLFIGIDASYFDAMYLDMNPIYRTDYAKVGLTAEESKIMSHQEMFNSAFVLSANIGKSWYVFKNYNIGFSLEVSNLLNNQNIKTGGYEQMRLKVNEDSSGNVLNYSRFDSKYFYMFGTTYYLNLYLRF